MFACAHITPQARNVDARASGLGQQAQVGELARACPWLEGAAPTAEAAPPDAHSAGEEPAPATPIDEAASVRLVGDMLRYSGPIGAGFAEVLARHRFKQLEIDSAGGLLEPALAAGRQLRERGVDVHVTANCASACVLVLAGGRHRSAALGARIGVHRFRTEQVLDPGEALADAQAASSEVIWHLQAMGVSVDLFHEMGAAQAEGLRELDHAHLRRLGLLTS